MRREEGLPSGSSRGSGGRACGTRRRTLSASAGVRFSESLRDCRVGGGRGGSRYKVHEEGMGRPLDENWGISQGQMKESGGSEDTSDISVRDFDLFRGYPPKEEEDAGMQGKECQVWKGPGVCTSSKYSCFFQSAPMT